MCCILESACLLFINLLTNFCWCDKNKIPLLVCKYLQNLMGEIKDLDFREVYACQFLFITYGIFYEVLSKLHKI